MNKLRLHVAALLLTYAWTGTVFAGSALEIKSPTFSGHGPIPARYSCQGDNISPPLHWAGVSPVAKSLALIVDDPDAPGGVWTHWLIYNLPATVQGLPEGAANSNLPTGSQTGINSWGKAGYGGMCPPSGRHRYRFQLYALDLLLQTGNYNRAALLAAMQGHIVAQAELLGTYRKH